MNNQTFINAKELSLSEWLEIVLTPESKRAVQVKDFEFPSDCHLEEYLETIGSRSELEVKALLQRFLVPCGSLGIDEIRKEAFLAQDKKIKLKQLQNHSYFRRLIDPNPSVHPWQGIDWVVDLLPHWPLEAEKVLSGYFLAHCQFLPDGRFRGFGDAQALIRKKFFEHKLPVKETLMALPPHDFELLAAHLYRKQGFSVKVTPKIKDGGFDVFASKTKDRENQVLHIECKRYEQNVGVAIVRQVLGTLVVNQATKAVIVASTGFTKPAIKEASKSKRIELIGLEALDTDFRKCVSPNWVYRIASILDEEKSAL